MSQTTKQATTYTELHWPTLLHLASRLGVKVWRTDRHGGLVPVTTLTDLPTNHHTEP